MYQASKCLVGPGLQYECLGAKLLNLLRFNYSIQFMV